MRVRNTYYLEVRSISKAQGNDFVNLYAAWVCMSTQVLGVCMHQEFKMMTSMSVNNNIFEAGFIQIEVSDPSSCHQGTFKTPLEPSCLFVPSL